MIHPFTSTSIVNIAHYLPTDRDFEESHPPSTSLSSSSLHKQRPHPRTRRIEEPIFLHQRKSYTNKNPVLVIDDIFEENEDFSQYASKAILEK
jgi:hypothetical protein